MVYILAQRLSGCPNCRNCDRKKHQESKGLLSKTWKHLIMSQDLLMCFQRVDFKTLDLSIFLCGDLSLGTHFCPASNLRQAQQIPSNKGQKVLCDVVGVLNFVISSGTKPAGGNSTQMVLVGQTFRFRMPHIFWRNWHDGHLPMVSVISSDKHIRLWCGQCVFLRCGGMVCWLRGANHVLPALHWRVV